MSGAPGRGGPAGAPIDLSECEREPIHVPGSIQPHGVLLALRGPQLVPTHVSANCEALVGVPAAALLGTPLLRTLGTGVVRDVRRLMSGCDPASGDSDLVRTPRGEAWVATWYRTGDAAVVELEPADEHLPGPDAGSVDLMRRLDRAVEQLEREATLHGVSQATARHIRRITGFDRVMVYHFHPDHHGEVVAEDRIAGAHSYLGHHFPAGDIPPQARRLYRLNPVRGVADAGAGAAPVPLLGAAGAPAADLDMTHSALRSLSPVHCEYLRNMGVAASLSVSLLRDGELWGLVACHHLTPRGVGPRVRTACRVLARVASIRKAAEQRRAEAAQRRRLETLERRLVADVAAADSVAEALGDPSHGALRLMRADGLAAVVDGRSATIGMTPPPDELATLVASLGYGGDPLPLVRDDMHLTDADSGEPLPGVLGLALPGAREDAILWFRREHARTVQWAGDPSKPVVADAEGGRLRPRTSFAAWVEEVRGRSVPWSAAEVAASRSIAQALSEVLLTRARERLAYLGMHDALTGLANRHRSERLLDDALRRAADDGSRVTALFVDLDGFKQVNDRLGHAAGDELLRECARRLQHTIRDGDIAARVGGDEFVVLCEGLTEDQAEHLAARVRGIFDEPFQLAGGSVDASASVGLAVSSPGDSPQDLVARADDDMYRLKRARPASR